jgi:hypothetical protein
VIYGNISSGCGCVNSDSKPVPGTVTG